MTLALIGFGIICLLEYGLWLPWLWRWRKNLSITVLAGLTITTIILLSTQLAAWSVLLGLISIYRGVNLLRIIKDRTQPDYLFHEAKRASLSLLAVQVVLVLIAALNSLAQTGVLFWWYLLAGLQLLAAFGLFATTKRHLRTTRAPLIEADGVASSDLPSLTVCIPARNETTDLETCLTSLIASDYVKLEIIVLDDCSQNKRTPEIIRGYAHNGVRFIAGSLAPEHWLAKNWAYNQLAKEANGALLLFCGVDARFETSSLQVIVRTMLQKKKSMLTVVPRNVMPEKQSLLSSLVQTGRYAWEFALPRRLLERPPVLSTCWLITKDLLEAYGGFGAAQQSILPERHLARCAARTADGYSFVCSNAEMAVTSDKACEEQQATAVRMRYPQLHRRPELVAVVGFMEFSLLVWPFIILVVAIIAGSWALVSLSLATCLLLITFYSQVMSLTYRKFLIRSLWLLPFAALYDIGLLNYSMRQYEFNEVIWKGRNVCVPLMRVYPSLPKL